MVVTAENLEVAAMDVFDNILYVYCMVFHTYVLSSLRVGSWKRKLGYLPRHLVMWRTKTPSECLSLPILCSYLLCIQPTQR